MAGESITTIHGNLTQDPELRFGKTGVAFTKLRAAATPRVYDPSQNGWVDGETWFVDILTFRELAENTAESLTKGDPIIAYGKLNIRTWQTKDGQNRSEIELHATHVGPDLNRRTATLHKPARPENTDQPNHSPDPWSPEDISPSSYALGNGQNA